MRIYKLFPHPLKALKEYAKHILDDNILIGIVHFDSFAKITLPMTRVKDSTVRKKIKEIITPPLPNNRRSNIWNGINLIFLTFIIYKFQSLI